MYLCGGLDTEKATNSSPAHLNSSASKGRSKEFMSAVPLGRGWRKKQGQATKTLMMSLKQLS